MFSSSDNKWKFSSRFKSNPNSVGKRWYKSRSLLVVSWEIWGVKFFRCVKDFASKLQQLTQGRANKNLSTVNKLLDCTKTFPVVAGVTYRPTKVPDWGSLFALPGHNSGIVIIRNIFDEYLRRRKRTNCSGRSNLVVKWTNGKLRKKRNGKGSSMLWKKVLCKILTN